VVEDSTAAAASQSIAVSKTAEHSPKDKNKKASSKVSQVSNLLNLFSEAAAAAATAVVRTGRRRDRTIRSPRNSDPSFTISSEVQLHHTKTVADAMSSLGGLRLLYPLLVADCTRQVAALRITGSLIHSSKETFQFFLSTYVDSVITYCCHVAHLATTTESLQVLFDLATSKALGQFADVEFSERGVNISRPKESSTPYLLLSGQVAEQSAAELISSPSLLSLLLDVAVATPYNAQLARVTVEWLRGICDDVPENSAMVLQHIGITPVLVLLSLWGVGGADTLFASNATEISATPAAGDDGSGFLGSAKRPQHMQTDSANSLLLPKKTVLVLPALPPAECYRLQQSCAKFVRQLITGTSGDQSTPAPNSTMEFGAMHESTFTPRDMLRSQSMTKPAASAPSLVTPSGFSVAALTTLMKFVLSMHRSVSPLFFNGY
jgi:hypothetical protein